MPTNGDVTTQLRLGSGGLEPTHSTRTIRYRAMVRCEGAFTWPYAMDFSLEATYGDTTTIQLIFESVGLDPANLTLTTIW